MTPALIATIVLLAGVLIVIMMIVRLYNRLVTGRNRFKNAFAQIDVQLKRRYDLIPNLVETAKAYMAHERQTLEAVIQARNTAVSAEQKASADPADAEAVKGLIAAEGVLRVAMPHWREFYSGWFMRETAVPGRGAVIIGEPGFDGHFAQNNGDFRVRITINEFGLRDADPVAAAAGRIWIIGDSMSFGWGVEQDQMYSSVIGGALNAPTYNVASPGTDVCGYQALLARMPEDVKPRAVVVGLVLENDVHPYDCAAAARRRNREAVFGDGVEIVDWIAVKRLLTRYLALYNFLAVAVKRVDVIRDALTALGVIREGHLYRRHIADTALDAAVEKTADELALLRAMLPRGVPFGVLLVPVRFEIKDGDVLYRRLRERMSNALTSRGIAFIDPFDRFVAAGFGPTHFAHDGHWSALGHRLAGEEAAVWLKPRLSQD